MSPARAYGQVRLYIQAYFIFLLNMLEFIHELLKFFLPLHKSLIFFFTINGLNILSLNSK